MKKYMFLIGTLFLVGCSSQTSVSEPTTATEVQAITTEALREEVPVAGPVAIESASESIEILDQDGLVDAITATVVELDAIDAKIKSTNPYKKGSELYVDVTFVFPDKKEFVVNCSYIELLKKWSVYSVTASGDPNIVYYVPSGSEFCNIYDIRTDELIQESKRDLSNVDLVEEFESQLESISTDGDIALENIRDKYISK